MTNEITLLFDDSVREDIKELKKYYHLSSDGEVFKKSLQLLKFAAKQEESSSGILFNENNELRRIVIE